MKSWIEQVAEATGKNPQTIRLAIQRGWEIGAAIKSGKTYNYIPHPQKIKELIGIDIGGIDDTRNNRDCVGCSHNCKPDTEERKETRMEEFR